MSMHHLKFKYFYPEWQSKIRLVYTQVTITPPEESTSFWLHVRCTWNKNPCSGSSQLHLGYLYVGTVYSHSLNQLWMLLLALNLPPGYRYLVQVSCHCTRYSSRRCKLRFLNPTVIILQWAPHYCSYMAHVAQGRLLRNSWRNFTWAEIAFDSSL